MKIRKVQLPDFEVFIYLAIQRICTNLISNVCLCTCTILLIMRILRRPLAMKARLNLDNSSNIQCWIQCMQGGIKPNWCYWSKMKHLMISFSPLCWCSWYRCSLHKLAFEVDQQSWSQKFLYYDHRRSFRCTILTAYQVSSDKYTSKQLKGDNIKNSRNYKIGRWT